VRIVLFGHVRCRVLLAIRLLAPERQPEKCY
jgi:hypothetical protein